MNCVLQRLKTLDTGQKRAGMTIRGVGDDEVRSQALFDSRVTNFGD